MPGRGWGIALLAAAVLAGCGSSGGRPQPALTSGQVAGLVAQLEAARATAAAGDVAGTKAALARFRASVARLRRAHALTDATAGQLRTGAARVLARVRSDNPPPAPQPTPAPTPAPAPAPAPEKKHGPGKPPGHEKPKGPGKHGQGEGGD